MESSHTEYSERANPDAVEAPAGSVDDMTPNAMSPELLASDDDWDDDWGWENFGEGDDSSEGELNDDGPLDAADATTRFEAGPTSAHDDTIALLETLATVMELGIRREIPGDIKGQIRQLASGDTSVDVAAVASQLIGLAPKPIVANLEEISFSEEKFASGKRFRVAIPDSWAIMESGEEQSALSRSMGGFTACPEKPRAVADVAFCDRIAYIEAEDTPGGEEDLYQLRRECGTDEFNWALRWYSAYCPSNTDTLSVKPIAKWDTEVNSVNTKCLVVQLESARGAVFQIWPYANDHSDYVLVALEQQCIDDVEKMRELAVKIAESIELDQPLVPSCLANLEQSLAEKVDADIFESIVENLSQPFVTFRQLVFDAAQFKYASETEKFDPSECTLAGAQGIDRLSRRAVPYLRKLLDAYDVQVTYGASVPERSKILSYVGAFEGNVFPTYGIFNEEDASIVENAGVFKPSSELESLRARLDSARYHLRETPNEATLSTADSPYSHGDSDGALKVGDVFELGTYHHDENGAYRPLTWRILNIKGTHALAVSTECIEFRHYSEFDGPVSWETSTMREWLNEDFAKAVFTPEDRKRISGARISNSPNDEFGVDGGNPTKDRLFLLSIEEAETLFDSDEDRKATPSPYAESLGANQWWWLRSPGHKDTHAAYVGGDGSINKGGSKACLIARSVRPAFYLKLERKG